MRPVPSRGLVALLAVALASCSTVRVRTDSDRVTRDGIASARLLRQIAWSPYQLASGLVEGGAIPLLGGIAGVPEKLLSSARAFESKGKQEQAAANFLKLAAESHVALVSVPEFPDAQAEQALLDLHNSSLGRFAELWAAGSHGEAAGGTEGPWRFVAGEDAYEVVFDSGSAFAPGYFDRLIAAGGVKERGIVRKTRDGYGAALAGIREQRPERAEEMRFYPLRGLHAPVTMTLDKAERAEEATRVTISLRNPHRERVARAGDREFPLSADYSAALALLMGGLNEFKWGLEGFLRADERVRNSGIFLSEPYDPGRMPVLLSHGLISVPIIWRDIVPEIMSDPDLSERYQILAFSYPSSFPVIRSSQLLRNSLAELREQHDPAGRHPLSRDMVAAGHSMGGILTHGLVAEVDDRLWRQLNAKPLENASVDPEVWDMIRDLAFFEPDPAVRRAVFIATPHRGANMAKSGVAALFSRIAKLPSEVLEQSIFLLSFGEETGLPPDLNHATTSIQSLRPGSPFLAALDESPFRPGVTYHSVIGDRGRGDTPRSSDGVVEYWSSRLDGAASELIVPTGHGAYKHAKAVAEIKRILREHAGLPEDPALAAILAETGPGAARAGESSSAPARRALSARRPGAR